MLNEHFETERLCFNTDLNYEENYAKVNIGSVPERLNGLVLKTRRHESASEVRILPLPLIRTP